MKAALFSLASFLVPLALSTPVVQVDVYVNDDTNPGDSLVRSRDYQHVLTSTSATTTSEQIPGWIFFSGTIILSRIHGNPFWSLKGNLKESFPLEDILFDPIVMSFDHPEDYNGKFNGTIGRGEISLLWEKSSATIKGRSPIGDFTISGEMVVDYSP